MLKNKETADDLLFGLRHLFKNLMKKLLRYFTTSTAKNKMLISYFVLVK